MEHHDAARERMINAYFDWHVEMKSVPGDYFFEIKRGEASPEGSTVITNDEIGRALLAFDLREPWLAHQIHKVFDEEYAEIFGRPEVTAARIIFLYGLLRTVHAAIPNLANKQMGSYTLTRFFLLYLLARILRANEESKRVVTDPTCPSEEQTVEFLTKCEEILKTGIVDLTYESNKADLDY